LHVVIDGGELMRPEDIRYRMILIECISAVD
jgi:hypothetical protein